MRLLVPFAATLAYAVSLVTLVIWPPVTALVRLVTWPFDRNRAIAGRFFHTMAVIWVRAFPLWRIRIEGRWPRGGGAHVVVANHQSFLDTFVLCNIPCEMKWVAKESLFRIPLFGWGLRLAGDIRLDRKDDASKLQAMAKAREYLDHGMSVMLFPEGTRSRDGQLLPFKSGAFRLAIEAGVPILPVVVMGAAEGLPKGGLWVRPARVTVRILDPVPTAGMGEPDVHALRDEVRARIARALGQEEPAEAMRISC